MRTEGKRRADDVFHPIPVLRVRQWLCGSYPRLVKLPAGILLYLPLRLSLRFDRTVTVSELPHTPAGRKAGTKKNGNAA
ncbi:hypothetical protein PTE31013_04356 [Pandoraea terrigena]|uniref:Uncharacterized protein n=1 Tax=Pandoraea terrigena TaxID=2508292 RepID=A0A5E4Y7V0_9BURK|nr:hypothetical protein PTE31013_04356 [Pandoraea terrigena]